MRGAFERWGTPVEQRWICSAGRSPNPLASPWIYFLSAGLATDPFAAACLGIGAVGIMMWAYFVPFHITHGPPLCGSVGNASSCAGSGRITMMCGPLTTH